MGRTVAGTGSVVMGKSPDGSTISIGGWGRVIGDEGSGYYIGLEALKAVSREIDGGGKAGLPCRGHLGSGCTSGHGVCGIARLSPTT